MALGAWCNIGKCPRRSWTVSSFTDNDTEEDEFISMCAATQRAADAWTSVSITEQKTGQVHIVKQLQQRRHAQNIKAVIKHCADKTSLLSQMYLPPQPHVNELDQESAGGLDTSAATHQYRPLFSLFNRLYSYGQYQKNEERENFS